MMGSPIVNVSTLATSSNQTNGAQSTKILGATASGTTTQFVLDTSSWALKTIDYAHAEVHSGSSFYFHEVITLGNGASQDYLITVLDTTKHPHFGMEINFLDGAGTTEIYETTDRTGTTLQTVFNRDRNSSTTNTTTLHKNISGGTTDGTRILWKRAGVGKTAGGTSGGGLERILKRNTKYIIRITNNTTNNNIISIDLDWYEHSVKG